MVISRRDIKRKRKDNNSTCSLLDNSPKRTKVHAQRKFAQGSNVSSPVITPVKEIEKQEKLKPDVLPEPQELLPMNRPHTEDFLTFLCFRGTPMLPPNLNFFNAVPVNYKVNSQPLKSEPVEACPPLANISAKTTAGSSERPFIAFGVRKRADPVLVSKHMDKKRRHALALQALRRKYQEQKMAKIRAVTISKLSEKVITDKAMVRTRSVTKSESTITKKTLPQKPRVKIVATKHVKIARTTIKTPLRPSIKPPLKTQVQKRMCLRSFRGRFIHHELQVKKPTNKPQQTTKIIKKIQEIKVNIKKKKETSSEFSSDDDQPLMKTVKVIKPSNKVPLPKVAKKCAPGPKKPMEINFRLTRASYPLYASNREQTVKRKIQITRSSFPTTKSPFVKLTPPKLVLKEENQTSKETRLRSPKPHQKSEASNEEKSKKELDKNAKKKPEICTENKAKSTKLDEKDTKKVTEKPKGTSSEPDSKRKPTEAASAAKDPKKKTEAPKETLEVNSKKKPEKCDKKESETKTEIEKDKQEPTTARDLKRKAEKPEIKSSEDSKKKSPSEKTTKKITSKPENLPETKIETNLEKDPKKPPAESQPEKDLKSKIKPKMEEPKITQRPTRKTKEAAAIYMEILGHKLVSEGDLDDDSISIDSFPELPNVRKTEQRENELKAKAKSRNNENSDKNQDSASKTKTKKPDASDHSPSDTEIKIINTRSMRSQRSLEKPEKDTETNKNHLDLFSDSDSSLKRNLRAIQVDNEKTESIKRNLRNSKTESLNEPTKCVVTRRMSSKLPVEYLNFSESEESSTDEQFKTYSNRSKIKVSKKTRSTIKTRSRAIKGSESDSDESTASKTSQNRVAPANKAKNTTKSAELQKKLENSFSDSDEEPLSKFTTKLLQNKAETQPNVDAKATNDNKESVLDKKTVSGGKKEVKPVKKETNPKKKTEEESVSNLSTKPKRECTKRPQNYLTLFSSSEDEDKYFHGFLKQAKSSAKSAGDTKYHATPTADLLCKDVDKRFGKGKVNMSTEQIEKWLTESAMAGGSNIKKETDEILKFEEKIPVETNTRPIKVELENPQAPKTENLKAEKVEKTQNEAPAKIEVPNTQTNSGLEKQGQQNLHQKPLERKTIFRKERKITVPVPNINAFSANNESSVYAFEADTEDIVNTPFRRPTRRPSSTATSRSEDSSSRCEEPSKTPGKFRLPQIIKQDTPKAANKQEVSLMLSTDESNSASIAVQLNLDSTEVFPGGVHNENQPTDADEGEQLFYIPLQPGKQTSAQIIQGVAVKLGTKGVNGPNQRVVMSAKLITHTPTGAQKLIEKPLATSTPMYPPMATVQKIKTGDTKGSSKSGIAARNLDRTPENNLEEFKYKIPSSPSASSSSSTKINTAKRGNVKSRFRPLEFCNPAMTSEFPSTHSHAALVEAPVFHPNDKEFQDPLEYIEKIRPQAEKFGICRIVPPSTFKPECKVSDDMRFTAYNQYVHKMLHRWGPNFKELMAITKYLKTQNILLTHPPWIGGMEIDLPRLYQIVQSLGGLKEVIEKKKWPKVSELMKIPKSAQDRVTKLDDIYCKYLLPYDTLSPAEREKLFDEVETDWAKRESRALHRSQQNIINRDSSPNNSESDSDDESEECIVKGRSMALNAFYRIARNTMSMWFKTVEPTAQDVELEFWKHVTLKQNHICVHSGSIDSGNWGYGFAVSKNSPFARHAWNLKVLTNNSGSVLRSMGPVMGVTVPTLHVGMVFSACCWYRDPHSLPWIEYLHTGGNKIWYGIPDSMSSVFHKALIKLVPNYCRNKSLWLPSDTAMVPPSLLVENGVSLCRTIQQPGQFIIVFPKAFTSSISTGYVVSESVYFAPLNWLNTAQNMFDELQKSCEPSMFSLERLLISIASDVRSNIDVLRRVTSDIENLREKEKRNVNKLLELGLTAKEKLPLPDAPIKKKKKLQSDNGDYECEICCRNLFISWVIESQEDEIYCPNHAIEYIKKKKLETKNCKLVFTYDDQDMANLIEKIKNTIDMKIQKKLAGKNP